MEIGQRAETSYGDDGRSFSATVFGRAASSTADLYPRLLAMQRTCNASGFAVFTCEAETLFEKGSLSPVMDGTGNGTDPRTRIGHYTKPLLDHLSVSPLPLIFHPMAFAAPSLPAVCIADSEAFGFTLALPAPLGAKGNGYVILFDVSSSLSSEQMIDLHRKALSVMRELLKMEFATVPALETLNEREIECLQLVGNGMKSEAIGERLNLSVHTVNAYLSSATTKLDAVNRIQAIAKAIRLGLIA